jgi:hypothetical protein
MHKKALSGENTQCLHQIISKYILKAYTVTIWVRFKIECMGKFLFPTDWLPCLCCWKHVPVILNSSVCRSNYLQNDITTYMNNIKFRHKCSIRQQ